MKKRSKILNFSQNADFFFEKYDKAFEKGDYLTALFNIRKALEMQPEDPDFIVCLAELYTEMEMFEESLALIFELMEKEISDDLVFGLACNFLGLNDTLKATECLTMYLKEFSGGEYEYEVLDMLELVASHFPSEADRVFETAMSAEDSESIERVRVMLERGDFAGAIDRLIFLSVKFPHLSFLQNDLSMAYFNVGESEKAVCLTKKILDQSPDNIQAICNSLIFGTEQSEELLQRLSELSQMSNLDEQAKIRIAYLYCDLGLHERAYPALLELTSIIPYDKKTIFYAAAAANNTKRNTQAEKLFTRLMSLDPTDTVAAYFKREMARTKELGDTLEIAYSYTVPLKEMRRRLAQLAKMLMRSDSEIKTAWETDKDFKYLVFWALGLPDAVIKETVIRVMIEIGGIETRRVLRRYLLDRNEPDDIKNDVMILLSEVDKLHDFSAYMSGQFVSVRIGLSSMDEGKLGISGVAVLEKLTEIATEEQSEAVQSAINIFDDYLCECEKPPIIKNITVWAAAVLVLGIEDTGETVNKTQLCAELKISASSLSSVIRKIEDLVFE